MFIVERIENDVVVIEQTVEHQISHFNVSLSLLPNGIKEGDVLIRHPNGAYEVNQEKTLLRRERVAKLLKKLENP